MANDTTKKLDVKDATDKAPDKATSGQVGAVDKGAHFKNQVHERGNKRQKASAREAIPGT